MERYKIRQKQVYIPVFLISVFLVCQQNYALAQGGPKGKFSDYNIILLVADCLRADHLSSYGYFRETSPNIDRVAKEGVLFEQAIAQANNTLLSFASIFTSQYVSSHGVNSTKRALSDSALTLAEALKIFNYRTAAFLGGPHFNPIFKLNQGFDNYYHIDEVDSSFKDTIPLALKWIKARKKNGEKFFLLIHGNDLHTPYSFPASSRFDKGYSGKADGLISDERMPFMIYRKAILDKNKEPIYLDGSDINHIIALYDEGINYIDGLIGDFLYKLNALGILDKTIVILTADHGEELFDHDWFFHDFNLYEGTIRVPLIMRFPKRRFAAMRVRHQVQLIDLMPTILELVGIQVNEAAQGHSLLSLLEGKGGPGFNQFVFSEGAFGGIALRWDKWKLIYYPQKVELYDLRADPRENNDLAKEKTRLAGYLTNVLQRQLEKMSKGRSFGRSSAIVDPLPGDLMEKQRMLRELYEEAPGFKSKLERGEIIP
jgi:arylsulfatase A-like enzyme